MLAVLFVAGLGVALAIPIIRGGGSSSSVTPGGHHSHGSHSRAVSPGPRASRSGPPTPSPSISGPATTVTLGFGSAYPKACEHPATPPQGSGAIAAYSRPEITISTLDGAVIARFVSGASLDWSPSGRWLLSLAGHLWTSTGEDRGMLFPPGSGEATWSPTSDCAFALSKDQTELFVARPGHDAIDLVDGDLQSFSLSSDGSHLAVATSATSGSARVEIASVDLSNNHSVSIYDAPEGDCCVTFANAWLDNDSPLFWIGPGVSVMIDGAQLQALDTNGGGVAKPTPVADSVVPGQSYVARCGDSLVAVVGGGRPYPTISHKRLATVAPGTAPAYLTPAGEAYQSPSCSSDGRYIAAVAAPDGTRGDKGHVTIVSSSGGVLQRLTSGTDLGDYNPEWGPPGTGVLFARKMSDSSTEFTLWYAPEGSSARATSIRATSYDWSATPPDGAP
ncbi:MAG: hypothetical protein QOC87_4 [Actinomycetota bacterium]|nr:hypothetical protein [Actinomycetota bacterium]